MSEEQKKTKKRIVRGVAIAVIVIAVLLLLAAGGWYYLVDRIYGQVNQEEVFVPGAVEGLEEDFTDEGLGEDFADGEDASDPFEEIGEDIPEDDGPSKLTEEGITNILLIGNDSRKGDKSGRSDAMILLTINDNTRKIYMTSFLRDMYVDIPGYQGNRLNASYAFGGAKLLMKTLEKNFDVKVDRYVLVNFQAFANVVDVVGGVDLELTQKEIEYVNGYLVEYNRLEGNPEGTHYLDASRGGMVHLNGPQALAYCRNRYIGSDFTRTQRQRNVLMAAAEQTPSALLKNPTELMESLLPNLTTNLTKKECLALSLQVTKLMKYDIVQDSIPVKGSYTSQRIRKMAVLGVDFEENKRFLKENVFVTKDAD